MWISYGNSLCSPGSAVASSQGRCSAGSASAPSNGSHIASASCLRGSATASSQPSRSGTTCRHSTEGRGVDWSMLSPAASPARTSPPLEREQESKALEAGCGSTWPESSKKSARAMRSSKTVRCSPVADLIACSPTLPRWGTMHGGVWSERKPSVRRTDAKGSGSGPNLPTLCASETQDFGTNAASLARLDKGGRVLRRLATLGLYPAEGAELSAEWAEWYMGFPVGWSGEKVEARSAESWWAVDPADLDPSDPLYLPRTAPRGEKHRRSRVKALGNAQVPACAAFAWLLLSDPGFDVREL